jgi:hypothetical protein
VEGANEFAPLLCAVALPEINSKNGISTIIPAGAS